MQIEVWSQSHLVAWIEYVVVDGETIVTNLQSIQPGKGHATTLLNMLKKESKSITLDDMSDHYRKSHNIYVKNGFQYVEEDGPEMIWRQN